ncbi:cyclase family protein [Rhizobium johnstonii]|uniref:cyclase family protein n=1 Tax=Rhizobium TaxID=379 RepID=UPI00102F73AD|nr:cyclase family protein [Rhizobium leguminosarum]TBH46060.1 cyclase family protein [Rhizobium leguminosarum]
MQIIDISMTLENGVPSDPPGYEFNIDYSSHADTVPMLEQRYPGLEGKDLIGGEAFALEKITLSTHNGTHVDAPWHYGAKMIDGRPARTIEHMPLDWFFRPAFKLDFRHFQDGYVVTPDDIDTELSRIDYKPNPLDIVVVNTSAGAKFGTEDYPQSGCGMGRDATLHLTSMGIKVVGTDAWSWDAPYRYVVERYAKDRDASIIWEGHKAGLETEYCQIEKLRHLDLLPSHGFKVICLPVKIHAASAGWTRAVAILEN